ncbi:hypothetical protein D9611_014164 [Ephemerocybe angulata]|uniref:NAD(P)-binding domain-containing protein n=1 Tax=Ephemerocybe angulata TaxID=980116 RepID=A0A8H5C327_9AGAR|nr:hypothetical protein D9611_014164 [Tulosesus angulatus]
MSTFITGGASQTGSVLASLLRASDHPVLFGSRSGNVPDGFDSVKFDWNDPSTFEAAFSAPNHEIQNVYLIFVGIWDPLPIAQPFIDLAVKKGVKRFVLLSASNPKTEKGPSSIGIGRVHTYLDDQGLDYVALRATWFTENLLKLYGPGIKKFNSIQTIVPTGQIPFVAVQDIAQAAHDAIVNIDSLPSREPTLIGPELVSYSEIAEILTTTLGRPITHSVITQDELLKRYLAFGLPELHATYLSKAEAEVENGSEKRHLQDPRALVGKVGVKEWIEKNKDAFSPAA